MFLSIFITAFGPLVTRTVRSKEEAAGPFHWTAVDDRQTGVLPFHSGSYLIVYRPSITTCSLVSVITVFPRLAHDDIK